MIKKQYLRYILATGLMLSIGICTYCAMYGYGTLSDLLGFVSLFAMLGFMVTCFAETKNEVIELKDLKDGSTLKMIRKLDREPVDQTSSTLTPWVVFLNQERQMYILYLSSNNVYEWQTYKYKGGALTRA